MNDLLDRIETDPLANLRPQSARENERALAFALELTEGTPALDAVRGRGILASMIADQRLQFDERAQAAEQARTGFSRPSNRVIAGSRTNRVSAEGSFAIPATLRSASPRPANPGSRISAHAHSEDRSVGPDQRVSPGLARAQAMSAAPAAMLGNSVRGPRAELTGPISAPLRVPPVGPFPTGKPDWGPQGQRLRTVDAPAYGRSAAQTAAQASPRTSARTTQSAQSTQSAVRPRAYATNGALAPAPTLHRSLAHAPNPSAKPRDHHCVYCVVARRSALLAKRYW
jgi:hypothetical protein